MPSACNAAVVFDEVAAPLSRLLALGDRLVAVVDHDVKADGLTGRGLAEAEELRPRDRQLIGRRLRLLVARDDRRQKIRAHGLPLAGADGVIVHEHPHFSVVPADGEHKVTGIVGAVGRKADLERIPVPQLVFIETVELHVVGDIDLQIEVVFIPREACVRSKRLAAIRSLLADGGSPLPLDLRTVRLDGCVERRLKIIHAAGAVRADVHIDLRVGLPRRQLARKRLYREVELPALTGGQCDGRDLLSVGKQTGRRRIGKAHVKRLLCIGNILDGQLKLPAAFGVDGVRAEHGIVADGQAVHVGAVDLTRLRCDRDARLCTRRIGIAGKLHVVYAVHAHAGRGIRRFALSRAEVIVQDLHALRAVDIKRIVGAALTHDVALDPDILMHQIGRVGCDLTVASNGDGRALGLVLEEAVVFQQVVRDLQLLHIAALVPTVVDLRPDEDRRHARVADGAVADRAAGRLEQEAACARRIDKAVVKQEARTIRGEVFDQRAALDRHGLIERQTVYLIPGAFYRLDLGRRQKLTRARKQHCRIAHAEFRREALIVVIALLIGDLPRLGVRAGHAAKFAADVGRVVGHFLEQAVHDLRAAAHIGAVRRVTGGQQRLRAAQTSLRVRPDQTVCVFGGVEALRQHRRGLCGDRNAIKLRAALAVALLEAETRAADDAEILKAHTVAVRQHHDACTVAAQCDLAADRKLPAVGAAERTLVSAVAEIFYAGELDIRKGHRLARMERLHIAGIRGIVFFVRQIGQIAGVGLRDHILVGPFDDGRLPVGIVDMADIHAEDADVLAAGHGKDISGIGLEFHIHAIGVDVVTLDPGQRQRVRRIQSRRHDGVGIAPRRDVEIALERLHAVFCPHAGLMGHARKDLHVRLGQ